MFKEECTPSEAALATILAVNSAIIERMENFMNSLFRAMPDSHPADDAEAIGAPSASAANAERVEPTAEQRKNKLNMILAKYGHEGSKDDFLVRLDGNLNSCFNSITQGDRVGQCSTSIIVTEESNGVVLDLTIVTFSASVDNAASEEAEVTTKCSTSNDEATKGNGGENARRGSAHMTWREKKELENEKVVSLGGKPQKKQRLPLSVARVMMKKQKEMEEKMQEELKSIIDRDSFDTASALKVHTFLKIFKDVKSVLGEVEDDLLVCGVDGILMDLGMSSMQAILKAEDVLNSWPADEVGRVLREYGEESNWYSLQNRIVKARLHGSLHSTNELVDLIKNSTSRTKGGFLFQVA
ncbi:hypothetical protein RND71_025168 [Anisodus tanguticus]|uniref:Uncharacterized protein n=1 Tax=Anisodus tanguticus TaxID=243964 RepID=A0AAE1V5J8_9SOLA|nr:hypothetical protein RND71_025168 [Anisodus tanguticus]